MSSPKLLISSQLPAQFISDLSEHYQVSYWDAQLDLSLHLYQSLDGIWLFEDEWHTIKSSVLMYQGDALTICLMKDEKQVSPLEFDYYVFHKQLTPQKQQLIHLQKMWSQRFQQHRYQQIEWQNLSQQALESIPPLLALGHHLTSKSRSHALWQNCLKFLEGEIIYV